jgi:hypothetical protein
MIIICDQDFYRGCLVIVPVSQLHRAECWFWYAAGSIICGVVYLVESAMRPSSGPLPQGSSSSRQPPVDANTLDNHDGQDNSGTDVDTWSSSDRLDSSSEWILRDSPDIDVTESKELDWGTEDWINIGGRVSTLERFKSLLLLTFLCLHGWLGVLVLSHYCPECGIGYTFKPLEVTLGKSN